MKLDKVGSKKRLKVGDMMSIRVLKADIMIHKKGMKHMKATKIISAILSILATSLPPLCLLDFRLPVIVLPPSPLVSLFIILFLMEL